MHLSAHGLIEPGAARICLGRRSRRQTRRARAADAGRKASLLRGARAGALVVVVLPVVRCSWRACAWESGAESSSSTPAGRLVVCAE